MKIINLPNIITCCNLLCGCLAVHASLSAYNLDMAATWIIAGAVFDFMDGLTARALGVSGPIGKELDSLADVVTFGVAPSAVCYVLLYNTGVNSDWGLLAAFLMAAFSALRLAKFNVDERQTTSFVGLPTPANALLWLGVSYLCKVPAVAHIIAPWMVYALLAVTSLLLIAELPMFSLKIKPGHMSWRENRVRYSFLALCVPLAVLGLAIGQPLSALAFIIASYIIMSACSAIGHKA